MIRFTDIVPAAPQKNAKPAPQRVEPSAAPVEAPTAADAPQPVKTPRKPRKSA